MSIKRAARTAAYVMIVGFIGVSVYLLTVGLETGVTMESQEVTSDGQVFPTVPVTYTRREPVLVAIYPLIALIVMGIGLLRDETLFVVWIGLILMLVFAAMLIFSWIAMCLAEAALLVVPISIVQWQVRGKKGWLIAGVLGAAVLIWGGTAFLNSAAGVVLIASGAASMLLLAWLAFRPQPHTATAS